MARRVDRRGFLRHSAATIGGVALAGAVGEGIGLASAAVGVNHGEPRRGGTLSVGLLSDVANYHTFNGAQGNMDPSAFSLANALYDPLFVVSADGSSALPMLALSATANANHTRWTVRLRQGVRFTNGDEFNAPICVANYRAAAADETVGLAIAPIIADVREISAYSVEYRLVLPFTTFPLLLADLQIAYMAHPSSFVTTYQGTPIGTGPFMVKSWQLNSESQFVKNPRYWRHDAAGRRLPYLDGLTFKTIPDAAERNEALASGSLDAMLQEAGPQIEALKSMKGVTYRTDEHDPRDPAINFLMLNTTGTLNQYFCWAGEFQNAYGIAGSSTYLQKGEAPPASVQRADLNGTRGAVDPSSLTWNTKLAPVLDDASIREACALAINRATYRKVIDANVGLVANGLYRATSPFYANPGYPAYNPTRARSLVAAYKKTKGLSSVGFVIDVVAGDNSAAQGFAFFQQQLAAVGITVTSRSLVQSELIINVVEGAYDCVFWNQFGGVDPSLNYVWFLSLNATTPESEGGLGMAALPPHTYVAGAANFAHQADPTVESAMRSALASPRGSASQRRSWQTVNRQFARRVPYLWLDTLVNAWAARSNVENWASATAGDGTTRALSPDGPAARFDQTWLS